MGMFGASPRESYDALYSVLNQPADTTALEREQAPGFFAGGLGTALGTGAYRGWSRGASVLGNVATPALRPIAKSIDELFGTKTDDWLLGEQDKANRALFESKLDPKTYGTAAQLLYGVSDVLTTVATTGANPYAMGGVYGISQAGIGMQEGLDPVTATVKGGIEGLAMGVSVALPASITGSLALRMASGGAINAAVGIPERALVSGWLNARGYPEMARQYAPFDATALATEVILGAAFGGLLGPRARAKLPAPEAVPPSVVDAALTANQATHAEIHTAPGIPTDTRTRQAHVAALDQAVEALVMGREVNVEALLRDAGFVGKRPDFDALRVIADELERAGAGDVVAQVRALEAEAKSRGLYVEPDALGTVVLSDKPAESRVVGAAGRESQVRIGEDYVPTRLMLVEASAVAATMTKADNQFRDRTRVASEQQIQDIASRLDAHLLMDAPVMDYGAPVLAADGTVIGGNGRAAAIGRAYDIGTAAGYREALKAEFGDAVDGMQRPMLVRVLQREVDVPKAAILSNEGQALRMSALEQAKVDAERLGDFRAFQFNEDGAVDLAANMPFIRSWVAEMPAGQRAAIMDADGRLSAEGAKRLQNAVLFKAYGDSPTLARLVEATDPGSRNIAAALTRAAPAVADAREAIERGDLYPLGLHDDLIAAVEKLEGLRRDGMPVDTWMKQIDAFGDGMTPEARLLVEFMDRNIRASRVISEGIFGFYNRLLEAGNPKQGSMFEASQPDKGRMLALALDEPAPMYARGMPDLRVDVPSERWLQEQIDYAMERGRNRWGVPYFGKITGSFRGKTVDVSVDLLAKLKGQSGEQSNVRADSLQYIRDNWSDVSKEPPYIEVAYNGEAWVSEGNHRIMVAAERGEKTLPVEIRYFDGGERADGPLRPDRLVGAPPQLSRGGATQSATAADLTTAFRAMFGQDADRLMEAGRVKVVQSVKDLPGKGHPADVGGMFWRGEAWVVADNTGIAQMRGRVLHEVGEHAGMREMLGDDLYQQVLDTVARKAETDPVFKEARALAEARANKPEHVPAETLAYLVENAPELPVVRRILAAVRQWVYRTTGGRFVDLTQADLQMMAVASLRRYAREAEIAAKGEDAPWYMTLFHGTPSVFHPEPDAPLGRLRWKYINTGEGAQAFGYGHYVAEQEWIARTRYRDRLVQRNADTASMTIERPGQAPFTFKASDGPAYRVGDRLVHIDMGGEAAGIAWAIRELKSGSSVENVRQWAENDLEDARKRLRMVSTVAQVGDGWTVLGANGKSIYREGIVPFKTEAEAKQAAADYNDGFRRFGSMGSKETVESLRDEIIRAEAALRAVDEVTQPNEEVVQFRPYKSGGKTKWDIQGNQLYQNGFATEQAARDWWNSEGKSAHNWKDRVIRPDITEVRPEPPKGSVYKVDVNDETYAKLMIWDAPLDKQPANVQSAFDKLGWAIFDGMGMRGEEVYGRLVSMIRADEGGNRTALGNFQDAAIEEINRRREIKPGAPLSDRVVEADEVASVILNLLGIPGHRFLDGETRAKGWDDPGAKFNLVLYSDDIAELTERYSRTGGGRDTMPAADPIEDTTMPGARLSFDQADAEIATATELSKGFLPAVECALRVGA